MSLKQQTSDLMAKVQSYIAQITTLVNSKPAASALSDNATALENSTQAQFLARNQAKIDAHAARRDNPHKLTAAQLGVPAKADVDALIAPVMQQGMLNISRFGSADKTPIPYVINNDFTVDITVAVPVVLAGRVYTLPAQKIDIGRMTSGYDTYYVYVRMVNGVIKYDVLYGPIAESTLSMFVGTISVGTVNNVYKITAFTINKVTRLGIYRISTTPCGSAIPATNGQPHQAVKLDAGWKP